MLAIIIFVDVGYCVLLLLLTRTLSFPPSLLLCYNRFLIYCCSLIATARRAAYAMAKAHITGLWAIGWERMTENWWNFVCFEELTLR